jgi:hypothetical protein
LALFKEIEKKTSIFTNLLPIMKINSRVTNNKGLFVVITLLLLAIATVAFLPTGHRTQQTQTELQYQKEASIALDSAYQATLSRINQYPYYEMASAFRGMYLQYYINYYNNIPPAQRGAFDTIVREHIATIDAQMRTLLSTTKLPIEEQEALHRILRKIRLQNQ